MTPSPLTRRLESLRAGLRARWLSAGVLRLLAETAGFLVLQFCVDRLLDLPVEARRVVLIVVLALFAWRLFVLVLRPLRKRVETMDMALAVERKHKVLDGGLASLDRKSTRLNSSHLGISYAVFC